MTSPHQESQFERELCDYLAAHGWLYSENDAGYDRELALYPEDLIGWLKDTQPAEWAKLASWHNGTTEKTMLDRVVKLRDELGPLALLRHGFKTLNARFDLCQFKPAHGLNPETAARYQKVRLRVVRQVHYSLFSENSIDLVFFVNGIPVATAELKTDFTQRVQDAIRQYRKDRLPKDPVTKKSEPLLTFKRGALVHFAVSTDEVHMTTKLEGNETVFLPFNMGYNDGAGNPPNPDGYRISYLWERVLQRDNWLSILGSYVHQEKREKFDQQGNKKSEEWLIFPRFHQWEAVSRLVETSRAEGPGNSYLIQHSAGSGKTNSISWLSHQLASLHDATDTKVFDSVIVVTDRTVLDAQLQDAIYQFEHKSGVVCRIESKYGAKSDQLTVALVEGKPIIIVTLQTFPFVLDEIRKSANLGKRRFAVIVDEAHTSMSGASAHRLRSVLTAEQIEEGETLSSEDLMVMEMRARGLPSNVSFYAFTATPKAKTIEIFGRRPDPELPPSEKNLPRSFHIYSMQQAIDECFILDVLENYMPYKVAYRIAHEGKEYDDKEVDKSKGMKELARWVRLHPYNIAQKVAIIVEHFRNFVAGQLGGQAKAMVVTGSRKEAVRYKLGMDAYLHRKGYQDMAALVAFSGEVTDCESGPDSFSESNMNPGLKGRDIRDAFDTDEFNVLLVANKYQTGFDQPKLVAMYVDKRLAGVAAVQTLSRLNRNYPGKEKTFILDFVNDPEEIRASFEPFYRDAHLAGVSNPDVIHDLQTKLDMQGIYLPSEVDAFANAWFSTNSTQKALQALIAPAVDRYRGRYKAALEARDLEAIDALEIFRKDMGTFMRAYDFLSQIFDYQDTDLEKRYVFYKCLIPWTKPEYQRTEIELSSLVLSHHRIKGTGHITIKLGKDGGDTGLMPLREIGGAQAYDTKTMLSELVRRLNDLFEGELTDADRITYVNHIASKLMENQTLATQAQQNTREQFGLGDFKTALMDTVIAGLDNYGSMASQVLSSDRVKQEFTDIVLTLVYDGLKGKVNSQPGAAAIP